MDRIERPVSTEQYKGHTVEVVAYKWAENRPEYFDVRIDGRATHTTTKAELAAKHARKAIDTAEIDDQLRPTVAGLIDYRGRGHSIDDLVQVEATGLLVGDVVYVRAIGGLRRGVIVQLGRTRVTVAYTTATSRGHIYRKSASAVHVSRAGREISARA